MRVCGERRRSGVGAGARRDPEGGSGVGAAAVDPEGGVVCGGGGSRGRERVRALGFAVRGERSGVRWFF